MEEGQEGSKLSMDNSSMKEKVMKQVTEYFRNAVASQTIPNCEYKKEGFRAITRKEVEQGQAGDNVINFLFKEKEEQEQEKVYRKNVIIAFKTVENLYENGCKIDEHIEDMTSIFFVPACIDRDGELSIPEENKEPWFPREYLEPVVDSDLAIGKMEKYDEFLDKMTSVRHEMENWGQYVQYAKDMYEVVTNCSFDEEYVNSGDKPIKLENKYYIFEDKMVHAIRNIMNLYNDLREQPENKLYQKLTNGKREPEKELVSKLDLDKMLQHAGQMNGEYPLSPSQREAVNHFNELMEGDILAVSGPPGTGKTTLLQSIVADFYVNAALKQEQAPIIVATSMNNQPVTNIIESFRSIEGQGIDNLEHKWITGADKFATYFPSQTKLPVAIKEGYQCSSIDKKEFFARIETEENRRNSKKKFIEEYNSYFDTTEANLQICMNKIYDSLKNLDDARKDILQKVHKLSEQMHYEEGEKYLTGLRDGAQLLQQEKDKIDAEVEKVKQKTQEHQERSLEWQKAYQELPLWVRMFKFLPSCKSHIKIFVSTFIDLEESHMIENTMTYDEVQKRYQRLLQECSEKYNELKIKLKEFEKKINVVYEEKHLIEMEMKRINEALYTLYPYESNENKRYLWNEFTIDELNNLVDKIRYKEFWLASHYYEAKWLLKDTFIHTEKQMSSNIKDILDEYYHRMAMISPCFVMTTFMLPKQFRAYDGNGQANFYLYNYVDLLIVDEAGQISPEMIAGAFSLAKKAVVVGDEHQISPVWGVSRSVDIALAQEYGVIEDKKQFKDLEENGLNCSQSNIMKVAAQSCAFNKYDAGLFLCEHRRCYDEIISFCNQLVYKGRLQPKRGSAGKNEKLNGLLPMGHLQVSVEHSKREGGSRINEVEAKAIVNWLEENYMGFVEAYQTDINEGRMTTKDIVGIITPFKRQSMLIKSFLRKSRLVGEVDNISVGTVHTFQGAERQIILFSSVYGAKDECFFIDKDSSMMNVAVSRAKDAFLVFGDRRCFSKSDGKATKLLGDMCVPLGTDTSGIKEDGV